ncbi:hypothetical protein XthCFBP4691_20410, partial [Xanthomonas theicola]
KTIASSLSCWALYDCRRIRGSCSDHPYPTLDAARADVFQYIERRHNPRMRRRIDREDLKFSTLSRPAVISG